MVVPVVDVKVSTRATDGGSSCVYTTVLLKYDIPLSEQVVKANTKYVVKWNFNLSGRTLNVPSGCIFDFDGGKIYNGSIVWNNTKVLNLCDYTILENIRESGKRVTFGGEI